MWGDGNQVSEAKSTNEQKMRPAPCVQLWTSNQCTINTSLLYYLNQHDIYIESKFKIYKFDFIILQQINLKINNFKKFNKFCMNYRT